MECQVPSVHWLTKLTLALWGGYCYWSIYHTARKVGLGKAFNLPDFTQVTGRARRQTLPCAAPQSSWDTSEPHENMKETRGSWICFIHGKGDPAYKFNLAQLFKKSNSKLYSWACLFYFLYFDALVSGARASQFLERVNSTPASANQPSQSPYAHHYGLLHSRHYSPALITPGRYHTPPDSHSPPEPAKIIQASQSQTLLPCLACPFQRKPQQRLCPWFPSPLWLLTHPGVFLVALHGTTHSIL